MACREAVHAAFHACRDADDWRACVRAKFAADGTCPTGQNATTCVVAGESDPLYVCAEAAATTQTVYGLPLRGAPTRVARR